MTMKYLAAYALVSIKTAKPSKDDVAKVLKSLNVPVDQEELNFVFEAVNGRDVKTLIAEGSKTMAANVAAPAAAAPAGKAAAAPAAAKAAAAPKEEEEDDGMFGLFD